MIDSKIKGTWIADELENGDFGYLTDLNGAPELPENFGNIHKYNYYMHNIIFIQK